MQGIQGNGAGNDCNKLLVFSGRLAEVSRLSRINELVINVLTAIETEIIFVND